MKNVLILKSGTVLKDLASRVGDYDDWFIQTFGPDRHRFDIVRAYLSEELPRAKDYDAVLMTGSPASVTELAPWMRAAGEFMIDAAEIGIPVLGVCFGHQLLARMLGGTVRRNPRGREIGTVTCELTETGRRDPLFEGIPASFEVQATHEDIVSEAPRGIEVLASNANTTHQAFRAGKFVRGVQFHPELGAAGMRALIEARAEKLEAEEQARGRNPKERLRELHAQLRPTPSGPRILENFLRHFT